ncbi:maleylacetate reductase [Nocardioides marmotae]|uniref:maleylacetate reductase n=1 Tax=Nocardioides marmotae TaxID=2663857 RepID=UPI0012B602C2|nr:maleylacetate reductase [Nocardioides marmotae]MBC9734467.1 maleylacetate reductase [Nocardioides marmotae]MTB85567.1 iron-containing alcohol dehydrogenase [Nocardioides marmotae]
MSTGTRFTYDALPGRILFGEGLAGTVLADELDRLGCRRVLAFAGEGERDIADRLLPPLGERVVGVFDGVRMHVPAEVAEAATARARELEVDGLLCIGGGSTTGTAKIVARETGLPILAVPTTYAGSEVTPVWGLTTAARKETGRDLRVLPRTVVYDPQLTWSLPSALAVASGLNAMAHSVEALWTEAANPVTTSLAIESVRALATGLRAIAADEGDRDARTALTYGAYLAGSCFAVAGSGLHHKICHALGGAFDLPHAETHATVLPHVLAFNAPTLGPVAQRLAEALGCDDAAVGLSHLAREVGAPQRLADVGMRPDDLDEAVDVIAAKLPIHNPRPVDRGDIASILAAALHGTETC